VFRALQNERAELALWYQEGCALFGERGRAEHLVLAAHEIREIIDRLVDNTVAPYLVSRKQLGDAVGELRQQWPADVLMRPDADWPEEELHLFRPFLNDAQHLFAPDSARPFKERELATFLDVRDPIPEAGDAETERIRDRLRAWKHLRDYFVGVCHHRFATTVDEFERRLSEFGSLVLPLLGPQIFPEQAEVARLLREAEDDT
jgi:hypothetical protein